MTKDLPDEATASFGSTERRTLWKSGHMHLIVIRALLSGTVAVLAASPAFAHINSPSQPSFAAPPAAIDLSSPRRAMDSFFVMLNSFDANGYAAMLTDDATLFFTGPPFPIHRVQGRAAIMKLVRPLFDNLRMKGAKGTVSPQGLEFQTWGRTSVVTFDIPVGSALDRRTFVLKRIHGQWKIAHLHASVTRDGPAPPPTSG
jgi:ketosteroid isomerase-like protein